MSYRDGDRVITLVGSSRFEEAYGELNAYLTFLGNVVLSVGFFRKRSKTELSEAVGDLLDRVHLRKIDLSDSIFVLNVGGYIGHSTSREIAHARRSAKEVWYLSEEFPDYQPGSCRREFQL